MNAMNNYDNLWQLKEDEGKLDCVIKIHMSFENVLNDIRDGRHILCYMNTDLMLQGGNVYAVEFILGPTIYFKYK